jgi:hypothetical protein
MCVHSKMIAPEDSVLLGEKRRYVDKDNVNLDR